MAVGRALVERRGLVEPANLPWRRVAKQGLACQTTFSPVIEERIATFEEEDDMDRSGTAGRVCVDVVRLVFKVFLRAALLDFGTSPQPEVRPSHPRGSANERTARGGWVKAIGFALGAGILALNFGAGLFAAQSAAPSNSPASTEQGEVEKLKAQVRQLQEQMESLRALIEKQARASEPSGTQPVPAEPAGAAAERQAPTETEPGAPQFTALSADPRLAMATKSRGGDLSGAGNLLRTDRLTVGGYGDFQFRQSSLNEKNDGGGTPTFQNTRFVLGIAAVLAKKQNIVFNSEIEYEFGSREIDIEQAFVDWKVRPEFSFRGGIFVPAIGRFNTYHDSNLNLLTLRPLINQYILPTAYRDIGVGIRGRLSLPHEMKLTYEADVLNGMQRLDADGVPTPFSRIVGQSSAAEPGLFAFQATNDRKAVAGRIGFSPLLGLEFGISGYNAKFSPLGDPSQSVTIFFLDGSYHRGPLAINGEYGRSNIVGGGIPRRSPVPPMVNPGDPESVAALGQFVAQPSPGQDGFYIEGAYKLRPRSFTKKMDEGSYLAPVVRFEAVRLDRTIPDFYLNRSRTTLGFNIAPSPNVIFKLNYAFNHTFGAVPKIPGPIGGADFGNNPVPFRDYGRNGFNGSIAYVF